MRKKLYAEQDSEELQKTLNSLIAGREEHMKVSGILQSKSMIESAKTIASLTTPIYQLKISLADNIKKLDKQLKKAIKSSNKMFWATIAYSVIMALLTCAIAYSALVQAGII